jgi:hypothetical protein
MPKRASSTKRTRKRALDRKVITEIVYTDKPVDISRELLTLIMDYVEREGIPSAMDCTFEAAFALNDTGEKA